jgi:hypothetical protein
MTMSKMANEVALDGIIDDHINNSSTSSCSLFTFDDFFAISLSLLISCFCNQTSSTIRSIIGKALRCVCLFVTKQRGMAGRATMDRSAW